MPPVRLIPREEWEPRLRNEHRCKPAEVDKPGLVTGEWWVTEHDRLFVVPVGSDGSLRTDDWQRVIIAISKLKPLDWDT